MAEAAMEDQTRLRSTGVPPVPSGSGTGGTPVIRDSASLGMTLFLAAEGMFFLGLLSALTVLGPAQAPLFRRSAAELSTVGLFTSIACLAAMSLLGLSRSWSIRLRWIAVGAGVLFLALQGLQYWRLLRHQTVVAQYLDRPRVLDGTARDTGDTLVITGTMADLPDQYNPHAVILPTPATAGTFTVAKKGVINRESYGPARNNFFSCYFAITAVHAVHLLGGLAALWWVTFRRRVRFPAVQLYWHTMNAIGIVCLVAIWIF
jgi:heme/copper-type cytochrome/quinol oxidase subunit 3